MATEGRHDASPTPASAGEGLGQNGKTERWRFAARQLRRFAPFLADAFEDGAWMGRWPGVAVGVPALAFVVGLLAPSQWPGIAMQSLSGSYLSTMSFMVAATAFGILSGAAGATLLIGYVLGDLLLNPHNPFNDYPMNYIAYDPFWGQAALVVPRHVGRLLITYAVLALLVVRVPWIGRRLSDDVIARLPRARSARVFVRPALYAAALGLLTYLWSQAAVPLNRPLHTFLGNPSMLDLALPLQTSWQWLVGAAMLAGVVRALAQEWLSHKIQTKPAEISTQAGWWMALPRTARVALGSVATVFLLSGILDGWLDALVALVGAVAIQILFTDSSRILPRQVVSFVTGSPLALRFALAVGVGWWLLNVILPLITADNVSFRPVLIGALLVMAILAVLFPRSKRVSIDGGRPAA